LQKANWQFGEEFRLQPIELAGQAFKLERRPNGAGKRRQIRGRHRPRRGVALVVRAATTASIVKVDLPDVLKQSTLCANS
jgi:hypothetical protein